MHIGLEATNLRTQELGGIWRYTESLIRSIAGRASPHEYSLLFLNALKPGARVAPPRMTAPNMRLVEVTSVSNFLFTLFVPMLPRGWSWPTVESFLGPVDVFHSVNAMALPQRQGRRVVTIHDLTCLHFPQLHPLFRRTLFHFGIGRAARLADAIIVPSAATRQDVADRYPLSAGKIRVVPEAPGDHFVPWTAEACAPVLARYALSHRGYFLSVGNIEPRKNLLAVIRAYNRLRADTRAAPVLSIAGGAGWKNQPIHRAAAASPFAADIRFLGYVPDPDIPALMSGALALVYPSIYEGFGLPPIEAMACGTPVVTSNRSSLPEVVGEAALLVDPDDGAALADAMARIAGDPSLREALRERGLAQAGRFSWDETARLTLEVYEGRPTSS
jgi:alpha-1,3-rhamnosyl/mannosyltransferase